MGLAKSQVQKRVAALSEDCPYTTSVVSHTGWA
jgi:hypothetical protein